MSSSAVPGHHSTLAVTGNDKAARALYALLDLSKSLSSVLDLDDLLAVIAEKASAVVEAERTSVFIYDPERQRLWTRVAQGLGSSTIELPVGEGVAGDVATTLEVSNVADAYLDLRFNRETDARTGYRTRTMLAAPVLDSSGALLGVIQSINKVSGGRFDEGDESLMRALAAHVAVAIERARLTAEHVESQRIEQSLTLANQIQMRMLPTIAPPDDAPFAISAHLRPAKHVGGDLYDFFWNDERLYFCLGDVSGKGVGSALVMAVTKTLFRANAVFHEDPARLMAAVNARLYEETDPTIFVTAFCGVMNLSDGHVVYSNAGHDRPLIVATGHNARPLDSRPGIALGVLPAFPYKAFDLQLVPGEALFLYSDGVTEATNRSEQLFSLDRLREAIESCGSRKPAEVVRAVLQSVDHFAAGVPQSDDIAMMCIQYRGATNE